MTGTSSGRAIAAHHVPHVVRTAMIMGLPFSVHLRSGGEQPTRSPDRLTPAPSTLPSTAVWESCAGRTGCSAPTARTATSAGSATGNLASATPTRRCAQVLDFAEIARRVTGGTFDIMVTDGRRTAPTRSTRPESSRAGRHLERPYR